MRKFTIEGSKDELILSNGLKSIGIRSSLVAYDSADNPSIFLKESLVKDYDYWKIVTGDGFSADMFESTIEVKGRDSKVFTLDEKDSVLDSRTKSLSYKSEDDLEMTVFLHESESYDNVAMDFMC